MCTELNVVVYTFFHLATEVPNSEDIYEGESNKNRKQFFKFNLLNESGTQLYHFST
jgi:hypothetical protein